MSKKNDYDGLGEPHVIGQGTYGCVHKPQMKCKNATRKNSKKVSKLMTKDDANAEMQEYGIISRADNKKEFYMGKPTKCNIEVNDMNYNAAQRCRNEHLSPSKLDQYALLVMKYGGLNLEVFANRVHKKWDVTPRNIKKIDLFWLEMSRLFYGLKAFNKNKIVHHDLKHQNIVYDEKNNRVNFIDFGFMGNKDTILDNAKKSKYWLSRKYHWSFPWEIVFYNEKAYKRQALATSNNIGETFDDYATEIEKECGYFFYSILPTVNRENHPPVINHMLTQYYTMLTEFELADYDSFLNKSVDTIDSYGVGMGLLYVLNRTGKFMDDELFKQLSMLFINMISPNVNIRFDVDQLLHQYETIMVNSGLLEKHNKRYENHLLVTGKQIPTKITKSIFKLSNNRDFIIDAKKLSEDDLEIKRLCPDGKEYKRKTRRCVAICKDGYIRDANFKCVRDKTQKIFKLCPKDKDRNPLTNRCVQKCKPGFLRNKTFKCRKKFNPFM